ncbi:MAG TPA: PAS domain S-box protein [Xanthobacteraceae bacterium]|nr:PAS domain S-box protein [Xanthobacteraceae bacterium]
MVTLVAGTTIAILLLVNHALESIIGARALLQIETEARLVAAELSDQIDDLKSDVTVLVPSIALDQLVRNQAASRDRSDPGVAEAAYQRIAAFLNGHLAGKPFYLQFVIVGVDDGGREILRIERERASWPLRLVPDTELQRHGETDYFRHATNLRTGEVYIAPVEFIESKDRDTLKQFVPILRATTPILGADGSFLGIIVVVAEMRSAFDAILSRESSSGFHIYPARRIYLTNDRGRLLLRHEAAPDHEYDGASGVPLRITDRFAGLSSLLGTDRPRTLMVTDTRGAQFGAAVVPVQSIEPFWMAVIATVPRTELMAPIVAFRRAAIVAGLGALIIAIVLAASFAASITKPLVQMTRALDSFVPGSRLPELAIHSTGEVGILARSFDRMASQISREIEQRARMFDELCDAYTRQNAVFVNAVEGILILDEHGNVESINPAAERMFGITAKEAAGLSISALLKLPASMGAALSAGVSADSLAASRSHEMTGWRSDGTTFPADVLLAQAAIGNRQKSLLFVRDVTARNIAEERFRLAVEASPSGMVMMDRGGTILLVNAETEKLFQYRREELLGKSVDILISEHSRITHSADRKAFFDNPLAQPMEKRRELRGLRKDGTELPIEVGFNPICMRDGSTMILSAINDISERKRAEQMKDEFVAMVSHELRTPLTSINASLALLAADPGQMLPAAAKRLLTIAHGNSQRLVRLIDDILDLEKIESGKIEFNLQTVEIRPLVEQAIEANRGFADRFNVRIRLESLSENFTASVDIDRLMQVMTNLLSNAVKYSPSGGEVLVMTSTVGNMGRIAVRDHGSGIPEKFKSRIFERFAQADSREAREKGGTGLGLSIVKQIMLRLGGEVNFESAPGGGTIFYVDLPRAEVTARSSANCDEHTIGGQIREVA